ncbi:MAG: CDGSH iron-sulfur domain-containing protein [Lutibacter sp.]|jgi:CDGSH iron-sulfur domain-containing protein 3|uniref:CDGSH iron-sulfur domain-containing protein n=1 Tax=uncultured Lutibacter sp. TaxID=437739 RepID=UPI001DE81F1A|nr:CDGSH iron-sulfur domain-containing protein [uncultured Lutibacter sp.]NQV78797.1 CDGSH iron-sulfur domain-containing protein [Lutibacter sp.]
MELPKRAGESPIAIELEEGKRYAWCTCGLSENQPLCDGKHKGQGMSPQVFVAEKTETKHFCTCKETKNGPFCDGSHK